MKLSELKALAEKTLEESEELGIIYFKDTESIYGKAMALSQQTLKLIALIENVKELLQESKETVISHGMQTHSKVSYKLGERISEALKELDEL